MNKAIEALESLANNLHTFEVLDDGSTQESRHIKTIREALQSMQWRPISEAPRDGSAVLLYVKSKKTGDEWHDVGHYKQSMSIWASGCNVVTPTHFMPLPPAPQGDE